MGAFNLINVPITGEIPDISTASSVRIPIVDDMEGQAYEIAGVLGGAITGSDATITVSKNGTTIATLTIPQSGSAEGDTISHFFTGGDQYMYAGDYLKVATNGASTNAVPWGFTIRVKR